MPWRRVPLSGLSEAVGPRARTRASAILGLLALAGCAPTEKAADCAPDPIAVETFIATADDAAGLTLTVYPLPWPDGNPHDPALAGDGAIWFTDSWTSCVGRLDPETDRIGGWGTPTAGSDPHGMTEDPDGTVWYAGTGAGIIGRVHPETVEITEHRLPEGAGAPHSLAVHHGEVWFTLQRTGALGRLDRTTGDISLHPLPEEASSAYDLAVDSAGHLWTTLSGIPALGRIDPATGEMREVPLPEGARPSGVAVDATGGVWYSDAGRSLLGVLDAGTFEASEFPTAGDRAFPRAVSSGPDGRIWYFEERGARLVGLDPAGGKQVILTVPDLPAPGRTVRRIAVDHENHRLWVAFGSGGALGRIDLPPPAAER